MVAKFLDLDKRKIWIRTVLNFIALSQFYSICQMLAKISRVESEKTESKFRNRKRKLLSRVHVLHQAGAVKLGCSMSQSCNDGLERYRKKNRDTRATTVNIFLFCRFRCRRRRPCLSSLLLWSRNFATMVTWHPPRLFITKVSYKCIRPPLQSHNAVRNMRLVVAFARNHHNGMKM